MCKIIEDSWDKDPIRRPSFTILLDALSPCLLSYTLNDDPNAINMWSRYFKDRTSVSMDEFLSALWKIVNGTKPPEQDEEGFVHLKSVEEVINPPGVRNSVYEVTLERFGLFVHWYGPLLSSHPGDTVFNKLDSLLRSEWYHGEISGSAAEELLRSNKSSGDFLIRCSLNSAPFTMSRLQNNSLVHYRINYNRATGGYKMTYQIRKKNSDEDTAEISGPTLPEFVKQASKVLKLSGPVKCTKFQHLFHKQKTISVGYEIAFTNK